MANRRNYGGNYGGGGGYGGGGSGGRFNSVNPWQSGTSPGRPSLLNQNLLSQLSSPDSQIALATKILSSLLPTQQADNSLQAGPPSLMSLGGGFGGGGSRFGGGGNYGGDRFRRDDRRQGGGDQFRNRRAANDRNRDRKGGDKPKEKPKKSEDEDEAKEVESKDSQKDDAEGSDEKKEQDGPLAGYENIPVKLFNCHVCGKTMWNDVSFDTHVKGRNHRSKVQDLEENYQIQTDLMRQIAAITLKLEEFRRGATKRRPYPDQYCKMCDLQFNGMTMFAHRSTEEHQKLKRFIHPSCELCNVDFQVRVEFDEHILTPGHLQQAAKDLLRKERLEKDPNSLKEQEMKLRLVAEEISSVGGHMADLTEVDRKLITDVLGEQPPAPYDVEGDTAVAAQFIVPAEGFFCKVCKLFFLSDEVTDLHCKTQKHYECYVSQLKAEATRRRKEKEADEKRKTESTEDSGSAKRRKTEGEDEELNGDAPDAEPMEVNDEGNKSSESADGKEEKEEEEEVKEKPVRQTARRGRGRGRK